MERLRREYEDVYRERAWAYSDRPDEHLIRALEGKSRGRAIDLGGGQGRHALALAGLGYSVTVVDSSAEGLHQVSEAAREKGLDIHTEQSNLSSYEADGSFELVVASLLFHNLSASASKKIAEKMGAALAPGGLFYMSLPGHNRETVELVDSVVAATGCKPEWTIKHLVTKRDRPSLRVARRNETRALAIKPR